MALLNQTGRVIRIERPFFQRDPVTCARELIGCTLRWGKCAGVIVETEAYGALNDEACHTWSRPSARTFVAKQPPGAAYVYFNYGMHWMLNVLVKGGGEDGFVLFRAIEPMDGIAAMMRRRAKNLKSKTFNLKSPEWLCSGPGKLAQALGVTGRDHGRDFCAGSRVGFFRPAGAVEIEAGSRIGISRAEHLPWRFMLRGSAHISVKPKMREKK
ncbi:MAG: DNA-3-methyladenine glycosylase [Chthoniobacteraceae bacterium]